MFNLPNGCYYCRGRRGGDTGPCMHLLLRHHITYTHTHTQQTNSLIRIIYHKQPPGHGCVTVSWAISLCLSLSQSVTSFTHPLTHSSQLDACSRAKRNEEKGKERKSLLTNLRMCTSIQKKRSHPSRHNGSIWCLHHLKKMCKPMSEYTKRTWNNNNTMQAEQKKQG